MPTPDDLSSLPPATLQAALSASKKRVRREKEKLQTEIRKLQKQLNQLDEGPDTSETEEVEVGRDVVGESQHKAKRQKIESPSDDGAIGERYSHWPIAKVRNVDPEPISSQRYARSDDETVVMTQGVQAAVFKVPKGRANLQVGRGPQGSDSEVSRLSTYEAWVRFEASAPSASPWLRASTRWCFEFDNDARMGSDPSIIADPKMMKVADGRRDCGDEGMWRGKGGTDKDWN